VWRALISALTGDCRFFPAASEEQLTQTDRTLGVELPEHLRNFLRETNGALGPNALGLVWPLERIRDENLSFRANREFRALYMPFDHLLFFADAGNGDQFAFAIADGVVRRHDVFAWNHEDDSRSWVAPSLKRYLEWWLSGKLKL
jgi:SMI1-KNR4 cell-wall